MALGPAYGGVAEEPMSVVVSDDELLADESATDAVSERAVKEYVDAAVAAVGGLDIYQQYFAWDALRGTVGDPMSAAAIGFGSAQFNSSAAYGRVYAMTASDGATNDGRLLTIGPQTLYVDTGLEAFGIIHTNNTLTNRVVRVGFAAFSTSTPGASGIYIEISGTTASLICRASSANTTHVSTYTVAANTGYRYSIVRNASNATLTIYSLAGAVLLTGTVGSPPSTSTAMFVGAQMYYSGSTGPSPEALGSVIRLGVRRS